MVICWLQTVFHEPSLTPRLCSPSKAAPQLVLAQVKPALEKGKDLLMGLLRPVKTWQVTGTNKHINRLTEDRNCWTFDLSNSNPGETWLEQYRILTQEAQGHCCRAGKAGGKCWCQWDLCSCGAWNQWGKEWLSQSRRMGTCEKAGINACIVC